MQTLLAFVAGGVAILAVQAVAQIIDRARIARAAMADD